VRKNGQCGDGKATYVLTRKPGEQNFEGEARLVGAAATFTVSP
jgi:hypothetical protein